MRSVFFDIDTQIDFMVPSGALYVPGAEGIVATVARLNRYAAEHRLPLISSADAHAENDPEFRQWPGHCITGTAGQQKMLATVLDSRAAIPSEGRVQDFPDVRQFVVQKQHLDVFTNPNLPPLLDVLDAERYVVYGVVTEICVRHAATGLLETGKPVVLVTDAVRSLDDAARDQMLKEFAAAGGKTATAAEIMA